VTPIDFRVVLRPPSGPDGRPAAVAEFDGRGDPVGVVDVTQQRGREPDVHVVVARQSLEQLGVHQWLDEPVAPRPAEVLGAGRDVRQHLSLAVDHPHDVLRCGVREDPVDDAGGLERPERLVVQADPAGIVDQLLAGVGDEGADAVPPEQVGQGEPDGPGPQDEDVGVEWLGGGTVPGCGGHGGSSASVAGEQGWRSAAACVRHECGAGER
jgi:hypothetical protein